MSVAVGMRFGRYEILDRLGAGAMGEVFRARDHDLGRDVAIKVLPEKFAVDPDRMGRFAQEARAASSLNHPNIVTIHEIGQTSGVPYIVMELVEGTPLRELLTGRPLDTKRLLDLGTQLAEGLAKAHAAGIVHRDVKPENVIVTRDRFVKILDFGLAKLRTDGREQAVVSHSEVPTGPPGTASPQTVAGVVLGTVGYMSPEQACGHPVDFRSDQFALGVILYEMAAGRRPFRGASPVQTLVAILHETPKSVGLLNPELPEALCWIIERCLAKEPEGRYASTLDLAQELRRAREHVPASTGVTAAPAPVRRSSRLLRFGVPLLVVSALFFPAFDPALRERVALLLHLRGIPADKRLAILPFRAASDAGEDRALADGLPDLLTVRLVQVERFQKAFAVEPTSNVRRAGVTSASMAARALGVNLVLSGSVRRLEGRLLLTASLEDAAGRRTLRAESAGSVEELLEKVSRMLELEGGPESRAALQAGRSGVVEAATLSAEALGYTPWSEGRSALDRYDQARSLEHAIELFNKALERDPKYALAHAGLAEAHWRLYLAEKRPEHAALAREHAARAVALDPLLSAPWVTLGMVEAGTGHAGEAEAAFVKALERDPRSSAARREHGLALETAGRLDEAETAYRKAIELRPADWANHSYLAFLLLSRGRCAEAGTAYRQGLAQVPDNARLWSGLGVALSCEGKKTEALAAFERSIALHPTPQAISNLATSLFQDRRYADAALTLEKATTGGTRDYRVWRNYAAALWWAPGRRQKAHDAYAKAAALAEAERKIRPGDPRVAIELADCYAMLGDTPRARTLAGETLRTGPVTGVIASVAAGLYEQIGDRAAALQWIGKAVEAGVPRTEFDSDPNFESLRGDRRYKAIASGKKETT